MEQQEPPMEQVQLSCTAMLTPSLRQTLKTLLDQESAIVDQCNRCIKQFSQLSNELQLMHHAHEHNEEERALKCSEFIRRHATLECECETTACDVMGETINSAASCDCICIQAACFRILHKWIPLIDAFRMKLLKIRKLCRSNGSPDAIETCRKIEKTVHNILKLKLKTTSE
jgi:hypothetical protein